MKKISGIVAVIMLGISLAAGPAYAQSQEPYVPIEEQLPEDYDPEDKYVVRDEYVPSTLQNLSKLYWALGALDLKNDYVIDNFLRINECDLYMKYFEKDLELNELRNSTREYIQQNLGKFPTTMEFIIPLGLDRYDVDKETFMLDPRSDILNVTRMQLYDSTMGKQACGFRGSLPGYPDVVILNLARPLHITEFKISPAVADLYIEEAKQLTKENAERYRYSNFGRIVYLRLKVTVLQFKDLDKTNADKTAANIVGIIDGYELYADRSKKLLMYSAKFENKRILRRKRADGSISSAVEEDGSQRKRTQIFGNKD